MQSSGQQRARPHFFYPNIVSITYRDPPEMMKAGHVHPFALQGRRSFWKRGFERRRHLAFCCTLESSEWTENDMEPASKH